MILRIKTFKPKTKLTLKQSSEILLFRLYSHLKELKIGNEIKQNMKIYERRSPLMICRRPMKYVNGKVIKSKHKAKLILGFMTRATARKRKFF